MFVKYVTLRRRWR